MTAEQCGFEIHKRFQYAEHLLQRWLGQWPGILFTRLCGLWKWCLTSEFY